MKQGINLGVLVWNRFVGKVWLELGTFSILGYVCRGSRSEIAQRMLGRVWNGKNRKLWSELGNGFKNFATQGPPPLIFRGYPRDIHHASSTWLKTIICSCWLGDDCRASLCTKKWIKTWLISSHLDCKSFVNNDLLEYSTRTHGTFTLLRCLANTTTLPDAISLG